jgi:hypothetical protein
MEKEREKVIDAYTHMYVTRIAHTRTHRDTRLHFQCTRGFSSVGPGRVEKQPSFPSSSSVDDDLLVKTVLSLKSQLLLSQANSTFVDLFPSVFTV